MADLSTGTGVSGGPPQEDFSELVQKWQGSDILPDSPTDTKAVKQAKGKEKAPPPENSDLITDNQQVADTEVTALTASLDVKIRKAVGLGYATLSQNELDTLQPGDPKLLGHKGSESVARGVPPSGPSGTGNPMFNVNPMVAFFRAFAESESMLKFLARTAAKLAMFSILTMKETGYAQAQATLEAGKAQAEGEEKQAWAKFAQGMLGVVSLGVASASILRATKSFKVQQKAQREQAALKQEDITEQIAKNRQNILKTEIKMKSKLKVMEEKHASGDIDIHMKKVEQNKAAKEASKRGELSEKQRKKLEEQQESDLEIIEKSGKKSKFEESKEIRDRKREQWTEKNRTEWNNLEDKQKDWKNLNDEQRAQLNLEGKKPLPPKEAFEKSIKADEKKIKQLEMENEALLRKKEGIDAKLKAFEAGRMTHIGQAVQGDPVYMMWNAIGTQGTLGMWTEAFGHKAAAEAALKTAYWKAWEELCGMFLGIENKSLDMALQIQQEAQQQINDMVNTINKMSDQETNSMRWTG